MNLKKNIKQIIVQVTVDWEVYSRNILNGFSKLVLSNKMSDTKLIILLPRLTAMDRTCTFIQEYYVGFPGGAVVESLPANAGDAGSSPGPGGSHMPWSRWAREPQLLSPCTTTTEAGVP